MKRTLLIGVLALAFAGGRAAFAQALAECPNDREARGRLTLQVHGMSRITVSDTTAEGCPGEDVVLRGAVELFNTYRQAVTYEITVDSALVGGVTGATIATNGVTLEFPDSLPSGWAINGATVTRAEFTAVAPPSVRATVTYKVQIAIPRDAPEDVYSGNIYATWVNPPPLP